MLQRLFVVFAYFFKTWPFWLFYSSSANIQVYICVAEPCCHSERAALWDGRCALCCYLTSKSRSSRVWMPPDIVSICKLEITILLYLHFAIIVANIYAHCIVQSLTIVASLSSFSRWASVIFLWTAIIHLTDSCQSLDIQLSFIWSTALIHLMDS